MSRDLEAYLAVWRGWAAFLPLLVLFALNGNSDFTTVIERFLPKRMGGKKRRRGFSEVLTYNVNINNNLRNFLRRMSRCWSFENREKEWNLIDIFIRYNMKKIKILIARALSISFIHIYLYKYSESIFGFTHWNVSNINIIINWSDWCRLEWIKWGSFI